MLADCRDKHNVAACGAIIATTQSESWTPSLERKKLLPLLSLEYILGWLFFPIAFLMGVPLQDCFLVGQLLGEKMGINEFVAYLHLANIVDQLSYRGIVISTYALCGFANFGSIAIQIGGIGGMAKEKAHILAEYGFRALLGATLVALLSAAMIGMFLV
jgi:CNT family concentrative nucleoside transporter